MPETLTDLLGWSTARAARAHALGVDLATGSELTLTEAAHAAGCDPDALRAELAACDAGVELSTLVEMTDFLIEAHHHYLRQLLPALEQQLQQLLAVGVAAPPELAELATTLARFGAELLQHLEKEEQVLFPLCRGLEQPGPRQNQTMAFLPHPIRTMEAEHAVAARELAHMRRLTASLAPVADREPLVRTLLAGLAELDLDMATHLHRENRLLYPAVLHACRALVP